MTVGNQTSQHRKIVDWSKDQCVWCQKPFDGSVRSRPENGHAHAIAILIRDEGETVRVRGWSCCICVTRVSNRQISNQSDSETADRVTEGMPIAFGDRTSSTGERYIPSKEVQNRLDATKILNRLETVKRTNKLEKAW